MENMFAIDVVIYKYDFLCIYNDRNIFANIQVMQYLILWERKRKMVNKDIKKSIVIQILKMMNNVALSLAVLSLECTCVWVHHQPKIPEGLSEIKKR